MGDSHRQVRHFPSQCGSQWRVLRFSNKKEVEPGRKIGRREIINSLTGMFGVCLAVCLFVQFSHCHTEGKSLTVISS